MPARANRWNERWTPLLGTASDGDVARQIGVSREAVQQQRTRLGIPPHTLPGAPGGHVPWEPEWDELLGSAPDRQLAQQLGVTHSAVVRRRNALKISPATTPRSTWRSEGALLVLRILCRGESTVDAIASETEMSANTISRAFRALAVAGIAVEVVVKKGVRYASVSRADVERALFGDGERAPVRRAR